MNTLSAKDASLFFDIWLDLLKSVMEKKKTKKKLYNEMVQ